MVDTGVLLFVFVRFEAWGVEGRGVNVELKPGVSVVLSVTSVHKVSNLARLWAGTLDLLKVSFSGNLILMGERSINFERPFHSFISPTSEVALVVVKSSSNMTWYCGLT